MTTKIGLPEHIEFPKIDYVPEGVDRPFWSVMIPTYNRTKLLEETIISVLEQAPSPEEMQIEVIDNCSPDVDTEKIVREIGKGRVSFHRQPYNVGIIANWNTCINRARGHWVHILHDDDTVLPNFYSGLRKGIEQESSIGAAFCRYIYMDEEGFWQYLSHLEMRTPGILPNLLERIGPGFIQCPAVVVKRSTYEKLGGFSSDLKYMFDLEMWMRIAVNYSFWYEPQPLACYRSQTEISGTSALFKTTIPMNDGFKLQRIIQLYLPQEISDYIVKISIAKIRIFSICIIAENLNKGNIKIARMQMQELLKYDPSYKTVKGILGVIFRKLKSKIMG
ncbi:MAG: glycosyltransferase [Phormidium sp.]